MALLTLVCTALPSSSRFSRWPRLSLQGFQRSNQFIKACRMFISCLSTYLLWASSLRMMSFYPLTTRMVRLRLGSAGKIISLRPNCRKFSSMIRQNKVHQVLWLGLSVFGIMEHACVLEGMDLFP